MKKGFVLQSLICLLAVSCSVHELDLKDTVPAEDNVFYASFESYSKPDTRVHVDENVKILWDEKDQISIFNKTTLNKQYEFMGKTDDNAGYFQSISVESGTGAAVDYVCAVYPYQESTSLESGVLSLTLPAEQNYKEKSFGLKANTMVSTTSGNNNLLRFKNVCGFLVLQLYSADLSVASIKLEGRNGEILSGEATMTPVIDEDPVIEMVSTTGTSITLNCGKVKLGTKSNKATEFWMVVPPLTFTEGISVTITDKDGTVFFLQTDPTNPLTVMRNEVLRLAAVEVGSINGHSYVDLGTGIKWATMNVGAQKKKQPGNFYAWGQTTPYDDPDYVYTEGVFNDVAAANWGSSWRMPTEEEWLALIEGCTWEWDGVDVGMKLTSKTNGKSIFLPAGGFYNPESQGMMAGVGAYWSSTQGVEHSARHLDFDENSQPNMQVYPCDIAMPIRPVSN